MDDSRQPSLMTREWDLFIDRINYLMASKPPDYGSKLASTTLHVDLLGLAKPTEQYAQLATVLELVESIPIDKSQLASGLAIDLDDAPGLVVEVPSLREAIEISSQSPPLVYIVRLVDLLPVHVGIASQIFWRGLPAEYLGSHARGNWTSVYCTWMDLECDAWYRKVYLYNGVPY